MSAETTLTERADDLAAELGTVIADLDAHEKFLEAKAAVEADDDLQAQIQEFERLRETFIVTRQTGDATDEDLRELQATQQELHDRPKMRAYLQAKSELELQLQELNHVISEPLEVDFGEAAGSCCQD